MSTNTYIVACHRELQISIDHELQFWPRYAFHLLHHRWFWVDSPEKERPGDILKEEKVLIFHAKDLGAGLHVQMEMWTRMEMDTREGRQEWGRGRGCCRGEEGRGHAGRGWRPTQDSGSYLQETLLNIFFYLVLLFKKIRVSYSLKV